MTPVPTQSSGVAADVIATFTLAMSIAGTAISMAVLVFAGSLDAGLPRAAGSFVVAGGVMAVWIAARSRIVPTATIVQDGPAIVAAAVVADFVGRQSAQVADVFVLLAATTLVTGIVLWLLGRFRLGGLVRYMPATVIGAFVAGTGWLLFKGGFEVMIGDSIGLSNVGGLFSVELLKFWLPGFVLGVIAWQIGKSDRFPAWAVGTVVVLALIGFYVVVLFGWTLGEVEDAGWLIGPFPASSGLSVVTPTELANADWQATLSSLPGLASVVGLSAVALLLNLTGIGSQLGTRVDVDAELRTAGVANLVAAPFGASPGFHAMGSTLLLQRLGATRRVVPILGGLVLVVLGALGTSSIGYVPRIVPGLVLITVGVDLLDGWARDLLRSNNRVEQALSVAILLVIGSVGILPGIAVGIAAACAVFIVRYSRIDPVRRLSTGRDLRSRVDRTDEQLALLDHKADSVRVFQLHGYLFFGSLVSLEKQLRSEVLDSGAPIEVVIVDFAQVTGIESSAYELLGGLFDELDRAGIVPIASSLASRLRAPMGSATPAHLASTLDAALEHAEQVHLGQAEASAEPVLAGALAPELWQEFTRVIIPAGTVAMTQGSQSDGFFIVESGHATVTQIDDEGGRHRLRRVGPLGMVGEIGVITGVARTAEVAATTDVVAWWMDAHRYRELRRSQPNLIIELHEFILKEQAKRVVSLSQGLTRSLR